MRGIVPTLALVALIACSKSQPDMASVERMLVAANEAKDRAMVAGDAADLERFYTADYRVIDDDGIVHDKRNQLQFMTREIDLLDAVSDEIEVRMLGQNAALLTGRMTGRYRTKGKEISFAERYTSVWVTEDNRWRVRHEHSSMMAMPR